MRKIIVTDSIGYSKKTKTVRQLVDNVLDVKFYEEGGTFEHIDERTENTRKFLCSLIEILMNKNVIDLDDLKILVRRFDATDLEYEN